MPISTLGGYSEWFIPDKYRVKPALLVAGESGLCETRTVVIDNGISMNLKITMYNVVFQKVEKNNFFSRRKFQLLL